MDPPRSRPHVPFHEFFMDVYILPLRRCKYVLHYYATFHEMAGPLKRRRRYCLDYHGEEIKLSYEKGQVLRWGLLEDLTASLCFEHQLCCMSNQGQKRLHPSSSGEIFKSLQKSSVSIHKSVFQFVSRIGLSNNPSLFETQWWLLRLTAATKFL